jgi:hypothetical protein
MRRVARQRAAEDSGQAIVEFALILPILIMLVLGAVDFGRAFNYKNDMTAMANTAARFAEVNQCTPCGSQSIEKYVASTADSGELKSGSGASWGVLNGVKVCFHFPDPTKTSAGDSVTAYVTADYQWLPLFHFGKVTIQSSETVRLATSWASPPSSNAYQQGDYTNASCP